MSTDSIERNEEQEREASDDAPGTISYALEALCALQEGSVEPLTLAEADAAAPVPEPAPEPAADVDARAAGGDERLDSLQSALDWYKDWLSSI